MSLVIGILTFVLVINCLFLMLLVLIQLPKKEAGAGLAFGGAATDALFGAGSGNALTQMTKYTATSFMVLALGLSIINSRMAEKEQGRVDELLSGSASQVTAPPPAPVLSSPTIATNIEVQPEPTNTAPAETENPTNLLAPAAGQLDAADEPTEENPQP